MKFNDGITVFGQNFDGVTVFETPTNEGCPWLMDYVMVWIKEPFIKNEESTKDVFISWVNKI